MCTHCELQVTQLCTAHYLSCAIPPTFWQSRKKENRLPRFQSSVASSAHLHAMHSPGTKLFVHVAVRSRLGDRMIGLGIDVHRPVRPGELFVAVMRLWVRLCRMLTRDRSLMTALGLPLTAT